MATGGKIAVFSCHTYDEEWFLRLNEELKTGFTFGFYREMLDINTVKLAEGCIAICSFVHDDCSAPVIQALKGMGVKTIALRCAGFDRVDLEEAERSGITVVRVPAYSPFAVAEHAVALTTALNRRIPHAKARTRIGHFGLNGLLGQDLVGKRVGIIGTGLIGSIAARIFKKGFESDVVAFDVHPNPKLKDPEPEGLGIPYVGLSELLATSDFIHLYAPLVPETFHMINAEAVKKMKPGVIIVNTARGALIENDALIQGIKDKIIGGAALDVFEGESPYFHQDCSNAPINDRTLLRLLTLPNLIITPHQAYFTEEAMKTISETTLRSIDGIQKGTGPPKQNGTIETVCKPPPGGGEREAPLRIGRDASMELLPAHPAPAPELKEDSLEHVENKAAAEYKVAVFSTMPYDSKWLDKMNADLGTGLTFVYLEARLQADTACLARGCKAVCIFVNDDASEPVLRVLKEEGIEMIALRCAGFNNTHLETAKELGMTVARVPAYSPNAVSEHAVTLALSVARKIPQACYNTRKGDFSLHNLLGKNVVNMRVGIIGTGLIGSITARIFKNGFNCDVVAFDVYKNAKIQDPPPAGMGIPYVELDELFRTSDVISLHAPLLPTTKHTINAEAIKKMKRGVIIVNTSRGGLIDTKALIEGLLEGQVGGAGIDVVEGEDPYFFKDLQNEVVEDDDIAALCGMNNVIVTSHQAFFTLEAMKTIAHTTIANINAVRNGLPPPKQKGTLDTVCLPPEKK